MHKNLILSLIFVVVISTVVSADQIDLSNSKIVVLSPDKKIMANAGDMLGDEIDKRTRIGLDVVSKLPRPTQAAIVIGTYVDLVRKGYEPPAGFEIPAKADAYLVWIDTTTRPAVTICAAGHDDRGTLFAVGRILRVLEMSRDKVSIDVDFKIATAPRWPLRGHQLGYRPKTNSYDAWTLAMWEQYYREMIVFGMNAVELIPPKSDDEPDSPHFPKPQLEMMIDMSQLAADYGLDVWAWWPAIDGDYRDEKNVRDSIAQWGDIFRKLPKLDVVFVPGGDPGGTHPAILFPFLEKQKKNLNKYHPKAQMWVSPQMFNYKSDGTGWLRDFLDILQKDEPAWLDGVVFGPQVRMTLPDLRKEVPPKYPIRRYPDITHCRRCQYPVANWDLVCRLTVGREPVNPRPLAYVKIFRDLQQYSFGFITYSEGCNDDFNKVLWSCLGWDPDMDVKNIANQYSRFFISQRYEHKFADGLFALERNWDGPVKDNDGIYETLRLFQEMEKNATPQEKLNWRFQQGLYRAYYDAYVKARLHSETEQQDRAMAVLARAKEIGSIKAVDQAQAILDKADTDKVQPQYRARAFELAEALYQSIRMQLSVKKYKAIRPRRGANLDQIDKPLNKREDLKKDFSRIRSLSTEQQRLSAIADLLINSN
ncbi:MAG: hypothetical protein ACYSWP_08770 [Planctomycetota bacterium]